MKNLVTQAKLCYDKESPCNADSHESMAIFVYVALKRRKGGRP